MGPDLRPSCAVASRRAWFPVLGDTVPLLRNPHDVAAPDRWTVSRSLGGTVDERLILIRIRDVDARYELYWADERLLVEATRWDGDGGQDFGRFEYRPHRIDLLDGQEDALSESDEEAVLAVCEAESARFWRDRRQEIRNLLPTRGHTS
jgi:hypothetical protein